jgi:hypothetical protein
MNQNDELTNEDIEDAQIAYLNRVVRYIVVTDDVDYDSEYHQREQLITTNDDVVE